MIQAYVDENHRHWDTHLQKFALALRTSINETTQVTPSLLNLGRELPVPFDRNLQDEVEADSDDLLEELQELPRKLQEIVHWVRNNIIKAQKINKSNYDKTHRHVEYEVGELVLFKNHGQSDKALAVMQKFNNRYIGPAKISKKISEVTYEIQNAQNNKPLGKRHVSDLKPYHQRLGAQPNTVDVKSGKKPHTDFPTVRRSQRNTKRVNYRTLAGYRSPKSQ